VHWHQIKIGYDSSRAGTFAVVKWVRRGAVAVAILAVALPAGVLRLATGSPRKAGPLPSPSPSISLSIVVTTPSPIEPSPEPAQAQRLLQLTNADRRRHGLAPLAWFPKMLPITELQTERMVQRGQLFHNPDLQKLLYTFNARVLGENVGVAPTVDVMENAFMNSPEHRANILNASYRYVTIYVIRDITGYVWATVNFITPK
jgi:uncharacterized protein YkwD